MLTQFSAAPGTIDLAWGHPQPELLAADLVAEAARRAVTRYGPDALGYGAPAGPPPLLDWLTAHLGAIDGRAPGPGELLITAGASQGLDLACTLLTRPGDVCLVPVPTYHLAVRVLRDHPLEIEPISSDEGGVLPDAVADTLDRVARSGRRARLLYLVPTSGNPTGITIDLERRRALAALVAGTDAVIVEDDVYRELAYDSPAPPSIWSLAQPGAVVRLGSFSKTLAPGVRVGWLTGDAQTVGRFVDGGLLDSGGGVNHMGALVVSELTASGEYVRNLATLRGGLRARRDALVVALREQLPSVSFQMPGGGYFVWLRLPDAIDGRALLPVAERHGVSFLPGDRFAAGTDAGERHVRLSFSRYPPDALGEAVARLATAIGEAAGS